MITIRRILVPTDFSDCALPAVRYAAELADKFSAELILLHVVPDAVLALPDAVMPTPASYTDLQYLWLPRTILQADFIVSMPKVKVHHWSGVTLSMKNMFGVVPGSKYGWPKNILHWRGIQQSILDICATVPIHFVIADAIIAMEGNGPLNGTPPGHSGQSFWRTIRSLLTRLCQVDGL